MKKILLFTLSVFVLGQSVFAYDFSYTYGGQTLYYNIVDGEAQVTYQYRYGAGEGTHSYENLSGSLTIPSMVTSNGINYYSVTSIGDYAFQCTGLTSVTIPNSVTTIGGGAFWQCTGLTSVTIPNSVTTIGGWAFRQCTGFTSVTIPNSVTTIGGGAFRQCTGLTSITIGNSVTSIGDSAFTRCTSLTSVTIPSSVTSIGDRAFSSCTSLTTVNFNATNCTTMGGSCSVSYTSGCSVFSNCTSFTTLNIGDNVQTIPGYAFARCTGLTSVTIPNSVTTIGNAAFYYCTGLASVTIGNSVTTIRDSAFSYCVGLTSVTIPISVTSIGIDAFFLSLYEGVTSVYYTGDLVDWCRISFGNVYSNPLHGGHNLYINNSLVTDFNLEIPDTFTTIGNYILAGCTGISSVTIPTSVTSIGDGAFQSCSGMTGTITIPNSVTAIGEEAFMNCSGLTGTLSIPNSVTAIGEKAFMKCSGLTGKLTIPNSVTIIYNGTFYGCTGLTSLSIGNSVTDIRYHAFSGCTGLNEIYSLNNVAPYLNAAAFDSVSSTIPVYIPCGALGSYQSWSSWWDNYFSNFIETIAFSAISADNQMGTVQILTNPTCSNHQAVVYASPNSGYRFDHWSDYSTVNPYTLTVNDGMTLIAYFEPIQQYTVTVTANNASMGSVSGGGTYFEGSTATLTATANNGYHFLRWQDDNTSNPRTITVTGNATYVAYFEANAPTQYTITVYSANQSMGSVSGDGTYYQGTSVTISAIPKNGYRFVRWQDNDISNPRTIIVTGNATYTAYFELDAPMLYTITVNSADPSMGSVSGGGMYCQGDIINISATPNNGYRFVRWQDNDISNPRSITVNSDATYTAYFDYGTVGIDDITSADGMKVYTRGNTIVIETSDALTHSNNQAITVYDVMGRVIKRATDCGQHAAIEIPVTTAGVYMVKVGDQPSRKVLVRP